jgi:hypothetical protein
MRVLGSFLRVQATVGRQSTAWGYLAIYNKEW